MKDLFKKLKKNFGMDEDDPSAEQTPALQAGEPAQPQKTDSPLPPAHLKREEIIRFIIDSLQPYVDEKAVLIERLSLYVLCNTREEEELAAIALYQQKPGTFQQEELERKLMNNFIQLAENWSFRHFIVTGALPECQFTQGSLGLQVITNREKDKLFTTARISVLTGQTEFSEYVLDPSQKKKYCIGRSKHPTLSSGRMHTNDIVFLSKDDRDFDAFKGKSNSFVSRNHAIIVFNPDRNKYFLYVDQGGLPENGNKTKIFKANGKTERVDIIGVAHELEDGDQIELGGEAKLMFGIG